MRYYDHNFRTTLDTHLPETEKGDIYQEKHHWKSIRLSYRGSCFHCVFKVRYNRCHILCSFWIDYRKDRAQADFGKKLLKTCLALTDVFSKPPPVTLCHKIADPYPPLAVRNLWMTPNTNYILKMCLQIFCFITRLSRLRVDFWSIWGSFINHVTQERGLGDSP